MGGDRFIGRVINPAIRGQNCPICLKSLEGWSSAAAAVVLKGCLHPYCEGCISKWSQIKRRCPLCNAQFDSWFYPSPRRLRLHRLPREGSSVVSLPRVIRARCRPGDPHALPSRRRFVGQTAEEKLRWRASVYRSGIRAVPLSPGVARVSKGNIVERIEPWIRRELQAALGDPDPTIIVHVASALYRQEEEAGGAGAPRRTDGDALAPLRPFLRHQTDAFWHELRCFAGSSLTMEAYDPVVEYR